MKASMAVLVALRVNEGPLLYSLSCHLGETEELGETSAMEIEDGSWTTLTRNQLSSWNPRWLKPFEKFIGVNQEQSNQVSKSPRDQHVTFFLSSPLESTAYDI